MSRCLKLARKNASHIRQHRKSIITICDSFIDINKIHMEMQNRHLLLSVGAVVLALIALAVAVVN